jgi:hypothetical protein
MAVDTVGAIRMLAQVAADMMEVAHILAWDTQGTPVDRSRTVAALVAVAAAIPAVGTALQVELDRCSQVAADSV